MRNRPFLLAVGTGLAGFGVVASAGFWAILAGPTSAEPVQGPIWADQTIWAGIALVVAGTLIGWITLARELRLLPPAQPAIRA
jgi:hypothetical protein